jgi:hypothetical protein
MEQRFPWCFSPTRFASDYRPWILTPCQVDLGKDAMVRNTQGQMDKFCQEKEFCGWFETSAKDNTNIEDACRFLVSKILENDQLLASKQLASGRGGSAGGRTSVAGRNRQSGIIRPGRDEPPAATRSGCCG